MTMGTVTTGRRVRWGLVDILVLVFALERHFAFDIGRDANLSVRSLIAFGAVSLDLVIG